MSGVGLSIKIEGLREVEEKFAGSQDIVDGEIAAGMKRATHKLTTEVQKRTPVDTDRLRSSMRPTVEGSGSMTVGTVSSGGMQKEVKYTPFVERGTKFMDGFFMFLNTLKAFTSWVLNEFDEVGERIAKRLGGS